MGFSGLMFTWLVIVIMWLLALIMAADGDDPMFTFIAGGMAVVMTAWVLRERD